MICELHIEGFGVIERLDLVLRPGLTVLTGETGAGKTMLIEALTLLMGGRADASVVRHGHDEARVEGRFVIDGEEHVVARVVPVDGRSRAYINGRLATAGGLAELAERAVEVHGQHEHQSLLTVAAQRAALDRFGDVDLAPLRQARATLTEIDAALAALGGDGRARARELDLLRFQRDELQQAGLDDPGEEVQLDLDIELLDRAAHFRGVGESAVDLLSADGAAVEALGQVARLLAKATPFGELTARAETLAAEANELGSALRVLTESIEEDADRLETLVRRRQQLRDLRRKYGDSLADVIDFRREVDERLAELDSYESRVAELELLRVGAELDEQSAAAAVLAARKAAAAPLATQIQAGLRRLAMPHAVVALAIGDVPPGDDVAITLAANPGASPGPLQRVASGGELARTMLALRQVISGAPESLLFDEVDAGIGGDAAVAVAEALARLAEHHQVLVVTHLAQVAALADHHVVVAKEVRDGATYASATTLSNDGRVSEIARMLSGSLASEAAEAHAAELLAMRQRRVGR